MDLAIVIFCVNRGIKIICFGVGCLGVVFYLVYKSIDYESKWFIKSLFQDKNKFIHKNIFLQKQLEHMNESMEITN